MQMRRLPLAVLVGAATLAGTGCASSGTMGLEAVGPGMRVRAPDPLELRPGATIDGTIARQVNGYFDVRAGAGEDLTRLTVRELEWLEVYGGKDRVRGGLTAMAATVPAGIVGGMLCARYCGQTERGARTKAPWTGALVGVAIGTGLGVALGPERWITVQLR